MTRLIRLLLTLALAHGAGAALPAETPAATSPPALVRVADGRLLAPDLARIVNRGTLIVALLATDAEPFFHTRDGVLQGVDIDLAADLARSLNVAVRYDRSARTYDEITDVVAQGRADIGLGKLARTLRRAQSVAFSAPYIRLEHGLLVHRLAFVSQARGQPFRTALRHFDGRIGVIAGSAWEEFGRRHFPKATLVPFKTWGAALDAVRAGQVTAVYRDSLELQTLLRREPGLALTLRTATFTDVHSVISVVVAGPDVLLRSYIDEFLAQRNEPPTVAKLLKAAS
ncbi:MAG: transporter substrate-binding domain-containing protein [Aquabacterium sp.]